MKATTHDYRDLLRRVPPPTLGQTVRFAWFVSGAHSWYKHLPLDRFIDFHFYLDPHAGMSAVRTFGGERAFVEITDESTRFHYTWQTTETYRRRFGYWQYLRTDRAGPHIGILSNNTIQYNSASEASIMTEEGEWVTVPPALLVQGTAQINGFVHRDTDSAHAEKLARLDHPDDKELAVAEDRFPDAVDRVLDRLLAEVLSDDDELAKFRPIIEDFRMLFDRPWDEELMNAGATKSQFLSAVATLQRRWLEVRWRKSVALLPKQVRLKVAMPLHAIAMERNRQLTGMWMSMLRFAEAVYA